MQKNPNKPYPKLTFIALLVAALGNACSQAPRLQTADEFSKGVYDGEKQRAERECAQIANPVDRALCRQRIPSSYDKYQTERDAVRPASTQPQ